MTHLNIVLPNNKKENMDTAINLSVVDCFKEDAIVSINPFVEVAKDDYSILIIPETGAWCAIASNKRNNIDYLSKSRTIGEIKKIYLVFQKQWSMIYFIAVS